EVKQQARTADLGPAFARLDASGADAELIGLAKACLASEPDQRPENAGAVAAAATQYLDGVQARLRQAELAPAKAGTGVVEEQKRRRWQLGLAAAVLLLIASGAAAGLWLQKQRADRAAEEAAAGQRVALAMQKAQLLREQGKTAEALAGAREAEALTQD